MTAVVRCGTLVGVLVLSVACSNANRPTAPSLPPSTVPPPPTGGPPPLNGSAASYEFSGPLSYPVRPYTTASKYVLSADGAFSLQYPSLGGEYVGTYREEAGRISFGFAADSRWVATGTLTGHSLELRYNVTMEMSDFENAVYSRSQ